MGPIFCRIFMPMRPAKLKHASPKAAVVGSEKFGLLQSNCFMAHTCARLHVPMITFMIMYPCESVHSSVLTQTCFFWGLALIAPRWASPTRSTLCELECTSKTDYELMDDLICLGEFLHEEKLSCNKIITHLGCCIQFLHHHVHVLLVLEKVALGFACALVIDVAGTVPSFLIGTRNGAKIFALGPGTRLVAKISFFHCFVTFRRCLCATQRAHSTHSAHVTCRIWGILGQLAIFLPISINPRCNGRFVGLAMRALVDVR